MQVTTPSKSVAPAATTVAEAFIQFTKLDCGFILGTSLGLEITATKEVAQVVASPTAASNALCINTSAAVAVQARVHYAKF